MKITIVSLVVAIVMGVGALIIPPAIDLLNDNGIEINVRQNGPFITLTWNLQAGALVYEVQGRMFDGDWATIGMMPVPLMKTTQPPGVASFRARAWSEDGPGDWSEPSEFLFFLPAPPTPEYEESDNSGNEAMMLLPWDPDLLEAGEFDDRNDA